MKTKWILIFISINLVMFGASFAVYLLMIENTKTHVLEELGIILDARLLALEDDEFKTISGDRNDHKINTVMSRRETALGTTGESYLVEEFATGCRMASRSRFEDYNNDFDDFKCGLQWTAALKSGKRAIGQWDDYRGTAVYGVGQRIARFNDNEMTVYAVIVERDVLEVRRGIIELARVAIMALVGLGLGSAIGCIFGYYLQKKQRRSSLENELTLKNVPSGIVRVDENRVIQSANAGMAAMFGYQSESELVGHDVGVLFPESSIQQDVDSFVRAMAGSAEPSDLKLMFEGKKQDGSTFPLELTRHVVQFPEGKQILKVFGDRTDEVMARKKIERKNKALRQFAAVARHDLQNTVSPAALAIEYQIEAGYDKDAMEMAHKELQGAMQMFQDLGVWSKSIEADSDEIEKTEIDLSALVEAASITGVDIDIADLGRLSCNEGMMLASVKNILVNAVNYCETQPHIDVWRNGNTMHIRDNAGGFGCQSGVYNEDYATRLAEPGQRGRTDIEGSGLGIANCTGLMEAHGFRFTWTTECGVGTTWNYEFA